MIYKKILLYMIIIPSIFGCREQASESEDYAIDFFSSVSDPVVEAVILKKNKFHSEIISNGKLLALKEVNLNFGLNLPIKSLYFKNGDKISKGDTIAILDNFELKIQLDQSKIHYERAILDLEDHLIGLGYSLADSLAMPKEMLQTAKIRTGFKLAKTNFILNEHAYESSILIAPIDGILANMYSKIYNLPVQDPYFCSVINERSYTVHFPIMESEAYNVQRGQKIEVAPYYNNEYILSGLINSVNPVVDENGMLTVEAIIEDRNNKVMHGMNVMVSIKKLEKNVLSIPKNAVTIRSDNEVVFTYMNGYAHWNNVSLGKENSEAFMILEGLSQGDTVIISNNLHLAHLSKVRLSQVN